MCYPQWVTVEKSKESRISSSGEMHPNYSMNEDQQPQPLQQQQQQQQRSKQQPKAVPACLDSCGSIKAQAPSAGECVVSPLKRKKR